MTNEIDIDKLSGHSGKEAGSGILPKARTDLEITEQVYYGHPCFVLKDPTTLRYYRLRPPEYSIFKMLNGKTTMEEVLKSLADRFPDETYDAQAVMSFIIMMRGGNLLIGSGENTTEFLLKRKKQLTRSFFQKLKTEYMFYKIPLFDPDKLLGKLNRSIGPYIFSKSALIFTILMFTGAVYLLFSNIDNLGSRQPLLSWTNLLFLFPALFCIKIIHEFGHGLVAKHFGTEVHEMGILFLVFMPAMYCDVSDAWMLSEKHKRVWITAAGIAVEIFLAGVATWVWALTVPGNTLNQFALNVMLAASINTIMFNGNPLLRYDGYYFVMDMLEIPNMKQKATNYLFYLGKKYVLGMKNAEKPIDVDNRELGIFSFAILSAIYRWFIMFAIIVMVWTFLDPYGWGVIGGILAISTIYASFVFPVFKFGKFLAGQWDSLKIHPITSILIVTLILGAVIGISWIPMEQSINTQCIIRPAGLTPLYVSRAGFVSFEDSDLPVPTDGMPVKAGDVIMRLSDPILSYSVKDLELQKQQILLKRTQAQNMERSVEERQINEEYQAIELQLERARQEKSRLEIISPIDGIVIIKNHIPLNWLEGTYLDVGTELIAVCKPNEFEAIAAVKSQDMEFAEIGQIAQIKLWTMDDKIINTQVKTIPDTKVEVLSSPAFSTMFKGDIPTEPSRDDSKLLKPSNNIYELTLPIEIDDSIGLRDGLTGRVKINYQDKTLGQTFLSWLFRTLRLDLGL